MSTTVNRQTSKIETYSTSIAVVYGEREAWQQGNDYTTSPWDALPMCPYNTMNDRVTNPVLYLDFIDHSPSKKIRKNLIRRRSSRGSYEVMKNWFSM